MDEESRALPPDHRATPSPPVVEAAAPPRRRGAAVVWLLAVAGLAAFVAFGTATIRTGFRLRSERSLPVTDVWRSFADELAEDGPATLVRIGVYGLVALVLVCSALGLWLALTADGTGPGSRRA